MSSSSARSSQWQLDIAAVSQHEGDDEDVWHGKSRDPRNDNTTSPPQRSRRSLVDEVRCIR
jgi:hypothetical protein